MLEQSGVAEMTNSCAHEIGPWPQGQQWPRCLKCEIERLRAKVASLYSVIDYSFIECDTCKSKPESSILCSGCLNNRMVVGKLNKVLREIAESSHKQIGTMSLKDGDMLVLKLKQSLSMPMMEKIKNEFASQFPGVKVLLLDKEIDVVPNYDIGQLQRDIASAVAHRVCTGVEHDAQNGKLHGCCVICGISWPCPTAEQFLKG